MRYIGPINPRFTYLVYLLTGKACVKLRINKQMRCYLEDMCWKEISGEKVATIAPTILANLVKDAVAKLTQH